MPVGRTLFRIRCWKGLRIHIYDRRNRCSQGVGHMAAWGKAVPGGGTANARTVLHGFKGQEQSQYGFSISARFSIGVHFEV